jgi:hypothetical protein
MNASNLIDQRIASLPDWRGKTLQTIRDLILDVDPDIVEEWKWMGTPVWSLDGLICTGETYKTVVKMTFAKGAALKDPSHLFNSSLEGNVRRAIDISEGASIDEAALQALVREAIALNRAKPAARKPDATSTVTGYLPGAKKKSRVTTKPAAKKRAAKKPAAKKPTAKKRSSATR